MAGVSEVAVGWQQRTEGVEKEKKEQQQKGKCFWETRSAEGRMVSQTGGERKG